MKCVITRQMPFFPLISDYSSSTTFGASSGVVVVVPVIAVVLVGVFIWRVLKQRNARKGNTRGYYGISRIITHFNFCTVPIGGPLNML